MRLRERHTNTRRTFVALLAVKNIAARIFKVRGSFGLAMPSGGCHTLLMAYRSKADWFAVDWSESDRTIAEQLGVSRGAVAKRRKQIGHASDYAVDAKLLRGWFEYNRARLPGMTDRDIEIEVFDQLGLIGFNCSYWRKQMSPKAHAEKAQRKPVAVVP